MDETDDRDPLEGLEARLQSHAKAFESLLALAPARDHYGSQVVDGQDPSEQWNRKKQTKEQKRAAKKAKLDPANQKSALDIVKEREAYAVRKRKREQDGEADDEEDDGEEAQKTLKGDDDADAAEARRKAKAERKKEKRQRKHEKKQEKKAKAEAKKIRKQERDLAEAEAERHEATRNQQNPDDVSDEEAEQVDRAADLEIMDFSGLVDAQNPEHDEELEDAPSEGSSAPTTPILDSPAFDVATNHSASSSSSSIVPPSIMENTPQPRQPKQTQPKPSIDTKVTSSTNETSTKSTDPPSGTSSPKLVLPDIDHAELQNRVRARIEALRAARKADGPDGKPAKSRQELLDQRRKKEEQRKAAKKEQRQKAKEEEARQREAQLRGNGSPLGSDIFSPRSSQPPQPKQDKNNYSFSRLAFEDGTSADPQLTGLRDPKKKKGPQDPRTALQSAQNKASRIAGYDADKQKDIADKDMWLHARQRAQGERVRDDTSLLKKALKRKEKQKSKSELAWKDREQAVVKGKEAKQKKRESNLQKRKEDRGGKGKKKGAAKGTKKKGRPGFEGRFKA